MSDRGFTTAEHLDEFGLINMNGRMYDPAVGRFISADPSVPYPDDMQSYNRYAYVRNNPTGFVDPSGYADIGALSNFTSIPTLPPGSSPSGGFTFNLYYGSGGQRYYQGPGSAGSAKAVNFAAPSAKSESRYDSFSKWTHTTLSVAGAFPILGAAPDTLDWLYTAGEIPFGKSSKMDLALASLGIVQR